MEGEKRGESEDESGHSEKQLDIQVERGVFKSKKAKLKKAKILFENKAKR